MKPSLAFLGESHSVMAQSHLWLPVLAVAGSTQRRGQSCAFGLNRAKNQQPRSWAWGFVTKQLQPRVTFFYCSGWCEPSQTSGFQSLPSLAQYWLMTGSPPAVWAVHTLYPPARKGGKGKQGESEEMDLKTHRSLPAPCSLCSLHEKG